MRKCPARSGTSVVIRIRPWPAVPARAWGVNSKTAGAEVAEVREVHKDAGWIARVNTRHLNLMDRICRLV